MTHKDIFVGIYVTFLKNNYEKKQWKWGWRMRNEFPVPIYLTGSFAHSPFPLLTVGSESPRPSTRQGKWTSLHVFFLFFRWQFDLNSTSVLDPKINFTELDPSEDTIGEFLNAIRYLMSAHDMKRLEAYADNLVDFHLVRLSSASLSCFCMGGLKNSYRFHASIHLLSEKVRIEFYWWFNQMDMHIWK